MSYPSKTASAGKYQSDGEDFIHFVDRRGSVKSGIDFDGRIYASDFIMTYGASFLALQTQVNNIIMGSLPLDIDLGVF